MQQQRLCSGNKEPRSLLPLPGRRFKLKAAALYLAPYRQVGLVLGLLPSRVLESWEL